MAAWNKMRPLTEAQMEGVRKIYDEYIRELVHSEW